MNEFNKQLQNLCERLLETLEGKSGAAKSLTDPTAWELKLQLKTSLAHLYMAIGMLAKENRIQITPEGLTYRVHLNPLQPELPASAKPQPPATEQLLQPVEHVNN